MTINDQIRKSLRDGGTPLNLDQLADANGWSPDERKQAGKNLRAMRKNGEVETALSEGRVCYGLVAGFKSKHNRGPGIHFGKTDGGRSPARETFSAQAKAAAASIAELDAPAADLRVSARAVVKKTEPAIQAADPRAEHTTGETIVVRVSKRASELIDCLLDRGLHGLSRSDVAQRLIDRQLGKMEIA
jgi:hypothetical protein